MQQPALNIGIWHFPRLRHLGYKWLVLHEMSVSSACLRPIGKVPYAHHIPREAILPREHQKRNVHTNPFRRIGIFVHQTCECAHQLAFMTTVVPAGHPLCDEEENVGTRVSASLIDPLITAFRHAWISPRGQPNVEPYLYTLVTQSVYSSTSIQRHQFPIQANNGQELCECC